MRKTAKYPVNQIDVEMFRKNYYDSDDSNMIIDKKTFTRNIL